VPAAAGPAPPGDPDVRKVVEKLAEFVAKNGRSFEDITRQRNPEDGPFRCGCKRACMRTPLLKLLKTCMVRAIALSACLGKLTSNTTLLMLFHAQLINP
jgi:hypothetical protein